jgi:hypothetical protein
MHVKLPRSHDNATHKPNGTVWLTRDNMCAT